MADNKNLQDSIIKDAEALGNGEKIISSENAGLSDPQQELFDQELELEQKYGDQTLRTFAERAASSASFGLTDQIAVKGAKALAGEQAAEEMQKGLAEREARNREAAISGEVAGIVGPALLSGGTSLGAKVAASGVKSAAKAGMAAEKITAKALAKVINDTGRKKLAKDVITKSIAKGSGSAVEGSFYGAGQLIKEEALGNAEFNAENFIANTGTAALLGGAAGGLFGAAEVMVPVIKNGKITDVITKKLPRKSKVEVADELIGITTPSQKAKQATTPWQQAQREYMPEFLTKEVKIDSVMSKKKILEKSEQIHKQSGNKIGSIVDDIQKYTPESEMPTLDRVYDRIAVKLNKLKMQDKIDDLEIPSGDMKAVRNAIDSELKEWEKWANNFKQLSAQEIKQIKTQLQSSANNTKTIGEMKIKEKIRFELGEALREELMDMAKLASKPNNPLAEMLKQENLRYATSRRVIQNLKKDLDKSANKTFLDNFSGLKDIFLADFLLDTAGAPGLGVAAIAGTKYLKSDFRRKLTLLTDIEKANNSINKKVTSSLKNFFSATKKTASPISTKILLNTSFKMPGEKDKKASNKKEAFMQVSKGLDKLSQDPDALTNLLSTNMLAKSGAAPKTAEAMSQRLAAAVAFLSSKLPRDPSPGTSLFARSWEPSSLEIAKFERYLQAVENPMSVLEDLESGTLTREGVETLESVYPDLYQRIQEQASELVAENPEMSYEKRLQLGSLLNIDSDTSLQSPNITALQQTFADEQQQKTAAIKPAVDTTQGGLEKISKSDSAKTQTEKISTKE